VDLEKIWKIAVVNIPETYPKILDIIKELEKEG